MRIQPQTDDVLRIRASGTQNVELTEIEIREISKAENILQKILGYFRNSPNLIFKIVAPDAPAAYIISEKLYKSIRDTVQLYQDQEYLRELQKRRNASKHEYGSPND